MQLAGLAWGTAHAFRITTLQRPEKQLRRASRDDSSLLSADTMGSRSPLASGLANAQVAIDSYSQCRATAVASLTSMWNDLELPADDRAAALAATDHRAERVWEAAVAQASHSSSAYPAPPIRRVLHSRLSEGVTVQAEAGREELCERTDEAHRAVTRIREQLGEAAEPPCAQQAHAS